MRLPLLLSVQNHHFALHSEKFVFWEDHKMLLIADAHFGKVSHFRKSGMAVPTAVISAGLHNLDMILKTIRPAGCVFLGDLFHSSYNHEWEKFAEILRQHADVRFILIKGNHDILPGYHFGSMAMEVLDELLIDDVLLTHHPSEMDGFLNICGHVHPGVKLRGRAFLTEKLPCYYLRHRQLILPSFGHFTGKKIITPKTGERIFVITPQEVLEVGEKFL